MSLSRITIWPTWSLQLSEINNIMYMQWKLTIKCTSNTKVDSASHVLVTFLHSCNPKTSEAISDDARQNSKIDNTVKLGVITNKKFPTLCALIENSAPRTLARMRNDNWEDVTWRLRAIVTGRSQAYSDNDDNDDDDESVSAHIPLLRKVAGHVRVTEFVQNSKDCAKIPLHVYYITNDTLQLSPKSTLDQLISF